MLYFDLKDNAPSLLSEKFAYQHHLISHFERVARGVEQFASVGVDQSSVSTVCSAKHVASQQHSNASTHHPTETMLGGDFDGNPTRKNIFALICTSSTMI